MTRVPDWRPGGDVRGPGGRGIYGKGGRVLSLLLLRLRYLLLWRSLLWPRLEALLVCLWSSRLHGSRAGASRQWDASPSLGHAAGGGLSCASPAPRGRRRSRLLPLFTGGWFGLPCLHYGPAPLSPEGRPRLLRVDNVKSRCYTPLDKFYGGCRRRRDRSRVQSLFPTVKWRPTSPESRSLTSRVPPLSRRKDLPKSRWTQEQSSSRVRSQRKLQTQRSLRKGRRGD